MCVCKMNQCPYNIKGECGNRLLVIDENGMCNHLWKKGQQRLDAFTAVGDLYTRAPAIIEGEWTAVEKFEQVSEDESEETC